MTLSTGAVGWVYVHAAYYDGLKLIAACVATGRGSDAISYPAGPVTVAEVAHPKCATTLQVCPPQRPSRLDASSGADLAAGLKTTRSGAIDRSGIGELDVRGIRENVGGR